MHPALGLPERFQYPTRLVFNGLRQVAASNGIKQLLRGIAGLVFQVDFQVGAPHLAACLLPGFQSVASDVQLAELFF